MDHLGESLSTTSNIRSHLNRCWRTRWHEGGRCQESRTGVLKRMSLHGSGSRSHCPSVPKDRQQGTQAAGHCPGLRGRAGSGQVAAEVRGTLEWVVS